MQLKFSGAPGIVATREHVWRRLTDPDAVAAAAPGVQSVEAIDPHHFKVIAGFGVGAIKLRFTLDVELTDIVEYQGMTIRARGTAPGSAVDVRAAVTVEAVTPSLTRLVWHADTDISGTVASVGGRLVESTSKKLIEQFWQKFAADVAATQPAGAPALAAGPSRLAAAEVASLSPDALTGAVLLAAIRLPGGTIPKGRRLAPADVEAIHAAAARGELSAPIKLTRLGPDDLHEDEASVRLARAVAGPGLRIGHPRQSRVDLIAERDGIFRVSPRSLEMINRVDPLEVFTLFDGQSVTAAQVVGAVKVAPHVVARSAVDEGERIAREQAPVAHVQAYVPTTVAAIVAEPLAPEALARFEAVVRLKVEALGSRFAGVRLVAADDDHMEEAHARAALEELVTRQGVPVIVVGGVSAGDPLSPFYAALTSLGGRLLRLGVPAHPGSMLWLAELGPAQILGVPQCGAFSMATAADLVLPRMLTGERLTADGLAQLGHGGLLTRDMRFRFPPYARERELGSPEP
ncbi:MAG: SRPBCC domain-containing protein [Gemmatimonadota bacterium]